MEVSFIDLRRQTDRIRPELARALMEVVDSQQFILGPAVNKVESAIAQKLSSPHAIGVASGSDALLLSLMAANIGPGDEVIVPAFTFFSTASAAARLGARVVFADIDFETFQIDPDDIRRKITPRTRAIMVVHLFGDCADMHTIQTIAADHGVLIVEDVAQAFGAKHRGKHAGTMGFCGCFSFYPTKNLAAIGDAGMVVTHDSATADRLRLLRAHGLENGYEHNVLGIASRLDSVQAAALSVRLPYVDEWNHRRRQIARRYTEGLEGIVTLPCPREHNEAVFNCFVIRTPERDALRRFLRIRGVCTEIYYPIPLHFQRGLGASVGSAGDFPRAEEAAHTCLALPIFPELEEEEIDYVIETVREFFE
jgi:dTDP-4-amino-4,6-dideoxygalactose transaminase